MNFRDHFMPQLMMRRVLYSLIPLYLFAIWQYGWRVLILGLIVMLAGIFVEYRMMRPVQGERVKVTESVLVTCALFTLTLPPATPYYIAVLGIVFGVLFGKGVFGGFGRNIFNPALVGRCFIYICFPAQMTMRWTEPFQKFPGGLLAYTRSLDAITSSTPMIALENGEAIPGLGGLILGTHASSIGEASILLILAAGIYLIMTKTASWKIMVSVLGGGLGSAVLFRLGGAHTAPLQTVLLTGGLFFAAVLMATDPISAPKDDTAKIIVGILIGVFALTIRTFGLFTEGAMFAVLIGNALTPLIERQLKAFRAARQARTREVAK